MADSGKGNDESSPGRAPANRTPAEDVPPTPPTGDTPPPGRPPGGWGSRWALIGLEAGAAVGPAVVFTVWGGSIDVDPVSRVGQISGLAALQFGFALAALGLVVAILSLHRWGPPRARGLVTRLGCAAVAGIVTGLVGGGMSMALRGTPWSLWAGQGDYSTIIDGINQLRGGGSYPTHYPPLFPFLMDWWSRVSGQPLAYGLKNLQLLGTALYGPASYLFWRLNLPPVWALGIGVTAMLPFLEPVKPYEHICLIVLLPVLLALLRVVRCSERLTLGRAAAVGAAVGAGLGLLFLLYSGWFVWFAPGVVAAFLIVLPWRQATAAARAGVVLATASVAFVAVSWVHLRGLFSSTGGVSDTFFYFDTCTDPTYIAMWGNDRPYTLGPVWPPVGEFGGVGLFTLLLAVGAGVAIALGWRRSPTVLIGLGVVGAWFIRMWLASEVYSTHTVRLYPRTLMAILYGLLVLSGYGLYYAVAGVRRRMGGRPLVSAPLGLLLIPFLFVAASVGSATVDKYLPDPHVDSFGSFAWVAQTQPGISTGCSRYATLDHVCGNPGIGESAQACGPGRLPIPKLVGSAVRAPWRWEAWARMAASRAATGR